MKNTIPVYSIWFVICVMIFSVFAQEKNNPSVSNISKTSQMEDEKFRSPFRYVIIAGVTDLEKYVNRFPEESLSTEVLLEDKDFTEKNLKKLFELLNDRFASTSVLWGRIYTSLEAIKTPEENDHSNLK